MKKRLTLNAETVKKLNLEGQEVHGGGITSWIGPRCFSDQVTNCGGCETTRYPDSYLRCTFYNTCYTCTRQ